MTSPLKAIIQRRTPVANDEKKGDGDEPVVLSIRGYRREKKVKIETAKGVETVFTLKEMFGGDRQKWQVEQRARYGVDYGGQPAGIANYEGMEAALISRCMFDSNDRPVPTATIQAWPSSTQAGLWRLCIDLNAISDKELEKLKVD
jgi:hypothetical protein